MYGMDISMSIDEDPSRGMAALHSALAHTGLDFHPPLGHRQQRVHNLLTSITGTVDATPAELTEAIIHVIANACVVQREAGGDIISIAFNVKQRLSQLTDISMSACFPVDDLLRHLTDGAMRTINLSLGGRLATRGSSHRLVDAVLYWLKQNNWVTRDEYVHHVYRTWSFNIAFDEYLYTVGSDKYNLDRPLKSIKLEDYEDAGVKVEDGDEETEIKVEDGQDEPVGSLGAHRNSYVEKPYNVDDQLALHEELIGIGYDSSSDSE